MTIKDAKLNFVMDAATKLFTEKSIGGVTVKDIAAECGLGEATVYRYFSGKSELIVACALRLQQTVEQMFLADAGKAGNGFEKLVLFYRHYLDIFKTRPELYRFLEEFDTYCAGENVNLDEYADRMDHFKENFMAAYDQGIADQSICEMEDIETFYYATTHALLALCKKLSSQGSLLRQDRLTDKGKEISLLCDTVLSYLKK